MLPMCGLGSNASSSLEKLKSDSSYGKYIYVTRRLADPKRKKKKKEDPLETLRGDQFGEKGTASFHQLLTGEEH